MLTQLFVDSQDAVKEEEEAKDDEETPTKMDNAEEEGREGEEEPSEEKEAQDAGYSCCGVELA